MILIDAGERAGRLLRRHRFEQVFGMSMDKSLFLDDQLRQSFGRMYPSFGRPMPLSGCGRVYHKASASKKLIPFYPAAEYTPLDLCL